MAYGFGGFQAITLGEVHWALAHCTKMVCQRLFIYITMGREAKIKAEQELRFLHPPEVVSPAGKQQFKPMRDIFLSK